MTMSVVLVKSQQVREQASRKTGKVYFFQHAAIEQGRDFPVPFEILHDDPKKAYPPGRYRFADDAIYVDRNGRLAVSARLVALPVSQQKG
jgi:hypothetical protein